LLKATPGVPLSDKDLVLKATKYPESLASHANTAGFISHSSSREEQLISGNAQKASSVEVLRILLSIGGSEIMHFQTWHDKAGNAAKYHGREPYISEPQQRERTPTQARRVLILPMSSKTN